MATENVNYFARVWDDDDVLMFSWEHQYKRNSIALVTTAVLVYAATRFATYGIEVSRAFLLLLPPG